MKQELQVLSVKKDLIHRTISKVTCNASSERQGPLHLPDKLIPIGGTQLVQLAMKHNGASCGSVR